MGRKSAGFSGPGGNFWGGLSDGNLGGREKISRQEKEEACAKEGGGIDDLGRSNSM